jgi:hypothetical protein
LVRNIDQGAHLRHKPWQGAHVHTCSAGNPWSRCRLAATRGCACGSWAQRLNLRSLLPDRCDVRRAWSSNRLPPQLIAADRDHGLHTCIRLEPGEGTDLLRTLVSMGQRSSLMAYRGAAQQRCCPDPERARAQPATCSTTGECPKTNWKHESLLLSFFVALDFSAATGSHRQQTPAVAAGLLHMYRPYLRRHGEGHQPRVIWRVSRDTLPCVWRRVSAAVECLVASTTAGWRVPPVLCCQAHLPVAEPRHGRNASERHARPDVGRDTMIIRLPSAAAPNARCSVQTAAPWWDTSPSAGGVLGPATRARRRANIP